MTTWEHERIDVNDQGFDRWRRTGRRDGPRVVVLGGVHGDETEGVLAAGHLTTLNIDLLCGTLDVVPACNELALQNDRRTSPLDDGNLARHFPGSQGGSATSRLASSLTRHVIAGADLLIDLHTAGLSYDMPFLVGLSAEAYEDTTMLARKAADAVAADFLWLHPRIGEGRSLTVVPASLYLEAPGGGPTDLRLVDRYVESVLRCLVATELLAANSLRPELSPLLSHPPVVVRGGGDLDEDMIRAAVSGIFLSSARSGTRVQRGHQLGLVVDSRGRALQVIQATADGWIMAQRRRSPVRSGDDLVLVAGQ